MSKAAELAALIGSQTALSNRNLIINGACQVNQRGDISGKTVSSYGGPDRFRLGLSGAGTWSASQSSTAPDGFTSSYKLDCTVADTTPTILQAQYRIEAQNLQHLNYGSAAAKKVTVSFNARSNVTGTYVLELYEASTGRSISQTYTIDSADTWEYKTLTYDGDTGGSGITNGNSTGLQLNFFLAASSTYTSGTLATSWGALVTANRAVGLNVNLASSTDNEFLITGLQLEVGEQATPFEHRSFDDELRRCKRYFQKSFSYDTAPENGGASGISYNGGILGYCGSNNNGALSGFHRFDPEMRANPTVTTYGNSSGHWGRLSPTNTGTTTFSAGSGYMSNVKASGINFGQNASGDTLLIGFGHITASAEL